MPGRAQPRRRLGVPQVNEGRPVTAEPTTPTSPAAAMVKKLSNRVLAPAATLVWHLSTRAALAAGAGPAPTPSAPSAPAMWPASPEPPAGGPLGPTDKAPAPPEIVRAPPVAQQPAPAPANQDQNARVQMRYIEIETHRDHANECAGMLVAMFVFVGSFAFAVGFFFGWVALLAYGIIKLTHPQAAAAVAAAASNGTAAAAVLTNATAAAAASVDVNSMVAILVIGGLWCLGAMTMLCSIIFSERPRPR